MMYDYHLVSVNRIIDGDSLILTVATEVGRVRTWRHRLTLLDTPERGEPGYVEAGQALDLWLRERVGRLRVTDYKMDSFGRYLSDVYCPGEDSLTSYMLRLGYAEYRP